MSALGTRPVVLTKTSDRRELLQYLAQNRVPATFIQKYGNKLQSMSSFLEFTDEELLAAGLPTHILEKIRACVPLPTPDMQRGPTVTTTSTVMESSPEPTPISGEDTQQSDAIPSGFAGDNNVPTIPSPRSVLMYKDVNATRDWIRDKLVQYNASLEPGAAGVSEDISVVYISGDLLVDIKEDGYQALQDFGLDEAQSVVIFNAVASLCPPVQHNIVPDDEIDRRALNCSSPVPERKGRRVTRQVPNTLEDVAGWNADQVKAWLLAGVTNALPMEAVTKIIGITGPMLRDIARGVYTHLNSTLTLAHRRALTAYACAGPWGTRDVIEIVYDEPALPPSKPKPKLTRMEQWQLGKPSNRELTLQEEYMGRVLEDCEAKVVTLSQEWETLKTQAMFDRPENPPEAEMAQVRDGQLAAVKQLLEALQSIPEPMSKACFQPFCKQTRRNYPDEAMHAGDGVVLRPVNALRPGWSVMGTDKLTRWTDFELERFIGVNKGSMSAIAKCTAMGDWLYQLRSMGLGPQFALKLMKNDMDDGSRTSAMIREFAQEYRLPLQMAGNPSILPILAHFHSVLSEFPEVREEFKIAIDDNVWIHTSRSRTACIAMPLLGSDLETYFTENLASNAGRPGYINGLTLSGWLRLFLGMLDALIAMWQYGIVHRDLKLPNVMVDAQGRAVIIDFGCGMSIIDPATGNSYSTKGIPVSTLCVGNQSYRDPAVNAVCNRSDATPMPNTYRELYARSDLWSIGTIMVQCLAGLTSLPMGFDPTKTPLHPDCPPELVGLLHTICRPKPMQRPTAHAAYRLVACFAYGPNSAYVTDIAQAGDWLTKERLRTMREGKAPHEHPLDFEYKTLYLAISTPESLLEDLEDLSAYAKMT